MKFFLIIGKSLSGKDTFLNNILNDKEFCTKNNLHNIIKYTTRPKRPNEIDGKDYFFIDNLFYQAIIKNDSENIIVTHFNTEFGRVHYIAYINGLDKDKNYIMVGDPDMIYPLKRMIGNSLCVIYLVPPNWSLIERLHNRDDNKKFSDKKYQEFYRRFIDDMIKFGEINNYLWGCDCIINVGLTVDYKVIKDAMKSFIYLINKYGISDYANNICFIKDKFKSEAFKMIKYNDSSITPLFLNVIDGIIKICNDKIIISSEEEKYTCAQGIEKFKL